MNFTAVIKGSRRVATPASIKRAVPSGGNAADVTSDAGNAKAVLKGLDYPDRVPNQFIVTFSDRLNWSLEPGQVRSRDSLSAQEAAQQAAALDHDCKLAGSTAAELSNSHKVLAVYCLGFKGFSIQMTDDDARKMAEDPRVSIISADSPMYVPEDPRLRERQK